MVAPVRSILTQIATKMVEKILDYFGEGGLADICSNTKPLVDISTEFVLELVTKIIEQVDADFCDSKLRKDMKLLVQQKGVKRTVLLPMGEIQFARTVYKSKETDEYVYPIDAIIGLEERERLSKELCARLIQGAADRSYEKSSKDFASDKVTRQTVKNKIEEVGELAIKSDGRHKKVAKLDIYADEDHVAMQDGSNKQVPLVVVSEGKEADGERQKLINPIAFQGCDMSPETFFDGISAYLREEYDIDNCEIVLHSDGAKRMKKASNSFMNVTYVMDEFHIKKHLKSLCAGEIGRKYALALRTCVECGNKEGMIDIKAKMMADVENYEKTEEKIKKTKAKLRDEFTYFINNWEAIEQRECGNETGSCTEAQISHILSERLSRNPMGWGKLGLNRMAMLRVYVCNGGKVSSKDVGKRRNENFELDSKNRRRRKAPPIPKVVELYQEYAQNQIGKIFDGKYNWSVFEKEDNTNGKVTGLKVLMKAYGKAKVVS